MQGAPVVACGAPKCWRAGMQIVSATCWATTDVAYTQRPKQTAKSEPRTSNSEGRV